MQHIDYSKLLSGVLTNIFLDAYRGMEKWASTKDNENDYFGTRAKKYGEKIFKRYNFIRVFGMNEPVPLTELYVRVNILDNITELWRVDVNELVKRFKDNKRSFGIVKSTMSGLDAINETDKFVLLGKPGAGKTTYLKYLALQSVHKDSNIARRKLPIFITLRDLAKKYEGDLLAYIEKEFDTCNLEDARQFIEALLRKGKCLILLDGLDEVPQAQKEAVIDAINDFSDKYDDNQYVLSCRIHAYNAAFPHFKDLELADFNDRQKQHFIHRWFKAEPDLGQEMWQALEQQAQLKELAATPVLLTLMCIDYDKNYDLQANRASIYKSAIEALLVTWDSRRRIRRDEIYKNLTTDRKMQLFSVIAAKTFEVNQIFIKEETLVRHIGEFLRTLTDVKLDNLESDSKAVLEAIVANHGIITPRAKGIYSFLHLTFQEYFTAKYILDKAATGSIEQLIHNHTADENWKEVFLLTANLALETTHFFVLLKAFIDNKASSNSMLLKILTSLRRHSQKESNSSLALRKSFILALSSAFVQSPNFSDVYVVARNLNRQLAFALNLPSNYKYAYDYAILLTNQLKKPPSFASTLLEISNSEKIDVVGTYLSANLRLVQCLNQPISITPTLKEKLLNEILDISEGLEEFGHPAASSGGLFTTANTMSSKTKAQLKALLTHDKREEVFEQLEALVGKHSAKEKELLLLQNRQYKLEAKERKRTISNENAQLESNQILEALLEFIGAL